MFRRIMISFLSLVLLAACGQSSASLSPSNTASADALLEILASHLNDPKEEPANVLINLLHLDKDAITDVKATFEEGDTGRLASVVVAKDNETALEVSDQLNYYLTTLQNSAAQYNPEALERIRNGYIYTRDNVSVLVISDDIADVKSDIANYFSK